MPTIAIFYGIVIRMYWLDHSPPHVHAIYQGFEALIAIETGEVIGGQFAAECVKNRTRMGLAPANGTVGQLAAWAET
jgi:hypothetical protein